MSDVNPYSVSQETGPPDFGELVRAIPSGSDRDTVLLLREILVELRVHTMLMNAGFSLGVDEEALRRDLAVDSNQPSITKG